VNEPKSLSRRTLARMLACDILYQIDLSGDEPEKVVQELDLMLKEGIEEEPVAPQEIPHISLEHVRLLLGNSADIEELVAFGSVSLAYPDSVPDFSLELVELYLGKQEEIDALIASYADRWSLERMPMIDRNLLRLGFSELLYRDDIPTNVTINEYLELAKTFSTEDSGKFINGILGKLVRDKGLQDRLDDEEQSGGQ
jgi:N utilization substance protein B